MIVFASTPRFNKFGYPVLVWSNYPRCPLGSCISYFRLIILFFFFLSKVSQRFLEDEGRYNYTTPKSFLELIDFYKELLRKKRGELDGNISRLANGLQTLRKTNNDVQVLQQSVPQPSRCR